MSEKKEKFRAGSQQNYQGSEVCLFEIQTSSYRPCELTFGAGLRAGHYLWTQIPQPSPPFSLPLASLLNLFKVL